MTSSLDDFELVAELAMALTGFAGVATAFGGRRKELSVFDRLRLSGVFLNSVCPLAGSLLFLIGMRSGQLSEPATVAGVAASLLVCVTLGTIPIVRRTVSASRMSAEHDRPAVSIMLFGVLVQLLLYALAALRIGGAAMLLAAFSSQFLMGIWLFWRLLTRAERE